MSAEGFRFTNSAGLQLFCRRYGDDAAGVPVVCLPGITRNSRDFEDLALYLSDRHPVVAPDLRGRGYSDHDPEWRNYVPGTYVADLAELLDVLAIERAVFIGTSLGGIVASLFAAGNPGRVAGIVLNDIGPEIAEAGLTRIKQYIGRMLPVRSWDEAIAQLREVYETAWPGLPDETWARLVRRSYRENDSGIPELDMDPAIGEAARQQATNAGDPWQVFAALKGISLLLLRGENSDILAPETVTRMLEGLPGMQFVEVANRGHVPLLDEPEAVAAIDAFLEHIE